MYEVGLSATLQTEHGSQIPEKEAFCHWEGWPRLDDTYEGLQSRPAAPAGKR